MKEVPKKLVVIGAGYVGSELGSAYANFGTEVTFLEGAKDILSGFEKQMTQPVKKGMKEKEKVTTVLPNAFATHPLKALFPKNKEDATAVILTANHFLRVQIKLMVVSIQHRCNGQTKNK